jgi:hypothetical protein
MRAGVSAAIVAASLLGSGTAFSACPPGHSRAGQARPGQARPGQPNNCLDLDLVPQISQQIGASEHIATRPKTAPPADQKPAYTGPTVGVSRTVRQAPTVGYRWAID